MKRAATAVSVFAAAMLVAPTAHAWGVSPTVSPSTSRAVSYAAAHNSFTGAVPVKDIKVGSIKVTKSGLWASALNTPRDHRTDPAQVLLRKVNGTWKAVDLGTDGVGCGLLKQRSRAALGLWGRC